MNTAANHFPSWLFVLLPLPVLPTIWEGVWKSARNNQLAWFICITAFNTVGILPIIYLTWEQKDVNRR